MDDPPIDPWSLYVHGIADATSYKTSYVHMVTVSTCAEWARMWNHMHSECIARPDVIVKTQGIDVTTWSFFRRGIKPEWEDPANHNGSTLTARVTLPPDDATNVWAALVLECARGAAPDQVVGVQVTRKKSRHTFSNKFDIWLSCRATPELHAWADLLTGLEFELGKRDLRR